MAHIIMMKKTDRLEQQRYYRKARKHPASGPALFALYHDLVQKTHKNRLPYHVSKNQYLVHVWACIRAMNGRAAHFTPKKNRGFPAPVLLLLSNPLYLHCLHR